MYFIVFVLKSLHQLSLVLHPLYWVQRTQAGKLKSVSEVEQAGATKESVLHLEIDRQTDSKVLEQLTISLQRILLDVRVATDDWSLCAEQMQTEITRLSAENNIYNVVLRVDNSLLIIEDIIQLDNSTTALNEYISGEPLDLTVVELNDGIISEVNIKRILMVNDILTIQDVQNMMYRNQYANRRLCFR